MFLQNEFNFIIKYNKNFINIIYKNNLWFMIFCACLITAILTTSLIFNILFYFDLIKK